VISIIDFELTRDEEAHAQRLHEDAVVIDALQGVLAADPDTYFRVRGRRGDRMFPGCRRGRGLVSFPGGVAA